MVTLPPEPHWFAILRAAVATADAAGRVHRTPLILACWRLYPTRFALAGAPDVLDSNRVIARLTTLVHRGYLVREAGQVLVLTPKARDAVKGSTDE